MPTIKEFDTKLKSFKNIRKITKTMKMVAASKLRRAHEAQANARLYARHLTALTSRISASVCAHSHPLLTRRPKVNKVIILVITSDKGLCGAFNHNANRRVAGWIRENRHHETIDIWCCGRKGFMYFDRHDLVKAHYEDVTAAPRFEDAIKIGDDLSRAFGDGRCDVAYLSYNQFINPLVQKTVFQQILPVPTSQQNVESRDSDIQLKVELSESNPYIFEPDADVLLKFLIPHFLYFKIYFALLENSAGEHGARMTAMDNATKNSSELIDRYTLSRNRLRQAAITTELTEIVSGAEALK
ncbi:MAG: ATP synthase F1 subunit gamma [Candidatus Omnitrophica bacterium]|nr:ATP synthase F1 subunit gamma [Candidatus Omnitrophota bacterium]